MQTFLATVREVFPTNTPFNKRDEEDSIVIHNDNKNFIEDDARM